MLSYALQVAELRKIAELEAPRPASSVARKARGAREPDARCLVCDARGASRCGGCGAVAYCGQDHELTDSVWHVAVCEPLARLAEDGALRARVALERLAEGLLTSAEPRRVERLSGWDAYLSPELRGAERRLTADLASRPLTLTRLLVDLGLARRAALRVHVMGATATELLALPLYAELTSFCPEVSSLELAFVGPQLPRVPLPRVPRVQFALHAGEYRRALWTELGTPDFIVGFDAGLLLYRSWQPTLFDLLRCGAPFALTSYRSWECRAEAQVLTSLGAVCVRPPAENPFASLACRRSSTVANDVSFDNSYLSVWR
jgi:hypothetical protein